MLDELSSCVYPSMLCFCLSYYTARQFVGLVDFGADTILQCFIADEEMLPEGRRYAGDALAKHIDEHGAPVAPAPADPAPEAELPDAQLDKEAKAVV